MTQLNFIENYEFVEEKYAPLAVCSRFSRVDMDETRRELQMRVLKKKGAIVEERPPQLMEKVLDNVVPKIAGEVASRSQRYRK